MESKYGEDGKCVGCEMWDCPGWEPWGWEQGKARVREREEPMVRWCRGMAHHCQSPNGHGIATSGVHMGIIVKFSEALSCVKSPVSRTSGPIYEVTCVENVLVRTPWKETWLELEMAGVETIKGWKVRRESDEM